MVVPEKASSFNIHPQRCCSDICHYCGLKFGMLDTPMHIMQLKTAEIQAKAASLTGFSTDACLCDKCFRYIDRKARKGGDDEDGGALSDSNHESGAKQNSYKRCVIRNCNREVITSMNKKWLIRLKKKLLAKKLILDWDKIGRSNTKNPYPVCNKHHTLMDYYMHCGLCKQKLTIGGACSLGMSKEEVQSLNGLMQKDGIPASLVENMFVCKLCKTFCGIKAKATQPNYLKNHKPHRAFYKEHKKR